MNAAVRTDFEHITPAVMRRQFPRWRVFQSNAGRWWATRTANRDKPDDLPLDASVSWAMTVDAGDLAGLQAELQAQEAMDPG